MSTEGQSPSDGSGRPEPGGPPAPPPARDTKNKSSASFIAAASRFAGSHTLALRGFGIVLVAALLVVGSLAEFNLLAPSPQSVHTATAKPDSSGLPAGVARVELAGGLPNPTGG